MLSGNNVYMLFALSINAQWKQALPFKYMFAEPGSIEIDVCIQEEGVMLCELLKDRRLAGPRQGNAAI